MEVTFSSQKLLHFTTQVQVAPQFVAAQLGNGHLNGFEDNLQLSDFHTGGNEVMPMLVRLLL